MYLVLNVGFILKAKDIEPELTSEHLKYSLHNAAQVLFLMRLKDTHVGDYVVVLFLFFFFCKIKYFAIPDFFNKIKYSLCYILLCIYIYKNKGLYEVLLPTILNFFQCNLNTGIYINFMKTKQRNRGLKL
jgi:hypothetical protein